MKRIVPLSLVLVLAAVLASSGAPVWAANCGGPPTSVICQCGDTVVDDYEFPANLTCGDDLGESVNGLIVASGVDVNLKGFKLTGTNKLGVGLLLQGSVGSVHNGRIQNFNVGIKSDGPISDWAIGIPNALSVHNNRTGLDLVADSTDIMDTAVSSNLNTGVSLVGNANTIVQITCSKNGGRGLYVKGDNNVLNTNRCDVNGSDGIFVDGDDNVLVRNFAKSNGGTGVHVVGEDNTLNRNQGRANDIDGIRGIGPGFSSDGRNYGTGNGGVNCVIDGVPTTGGGRYC